MANYTSVLTMLLRLRQSELFHTGQTIMTPLTACDHPSLVASSLLVDIDAIENKGQGPGVNETDQADELADLLGGLGVVGGKKCQVCFIR